MAFNIGFYAYAIIGHTRAHQLLPQLLMEHFDTLPIQCRHIEHMHEGESLLDFHQTLQPCSYMQDKYFRQKVRARGQFY